MTLSRVDDANITDADLTELTKSLIIGSYTQTMAEYEQLGLHTVPKSQGYINAIKNSRMITDISWIAESNIARVDRAAYKFRDHFIPGVEYKGVPYSSPADRYVGINKSFETFLSAAGEPRSIYNEKSDFIGTYNGNDSYSEYYGAIPSNYIAYTSSTEFPVPGV